MYKKRINDWQLHKNRKASEKEEISRIMEANQKLGVDLGEPMVNGRMVKMHLIERHRKEKRKAGSPSRTVSLALQDVLKSWSDLKKVLESRYNGSQRRPVYKARPTAEPNTFRFNILLTDWRPCGLPKL